jgi:hypothetical protein
MEKKVSLQKNEVTPALANSISDSVYPFVVGLIHADDLVGSGTLIRVGERFGILTAYHVVHNVTPKFDFRAGSTDNLGLIILPREQVHRFEIPLGLGVTTLIDIAKPTVEDASRDFFNLGVNREKGLHLTLTEKDPMVVSGFYHEGHVTELNTDGFSIVRGFRGFAGLTRIENLREHAGYDLCDVTVDYSLADRLPDSFGGYSGGGLWNVVLTKNQKTGEIGHRPPIFAGVVFYQEQINETRKILRCHLTTSVYNHTFNALTMA